MPAYTQGAQLSDVLKWEPNALYCRERVTVVSGQNLALGAVLGRITASGKVTALNPGASDGSQTAVGVLLAPVDASGGDKAGVMVARHALVAAESLVWGGGVTGGQKTTALGQLASAGIVARTQI